MNQNLKILMADDTEELGKAVEKELRELGCEVVLCARNGDSVTALLDAQRFDAVIMDVFMSASDGLAVLEHINESIEQRPFVIMMSGVDSSEFEEQIISAGADYFFIKPVKPSAIAKRIERLMNWRSNKNRKPKAPMDDDIEVVVSDIMRQIGVPAHIKGYQYLRTAIILCTENSEMLSSVTKILYPTVAKQYGTTASRVERAIRHAIEVAWDRGDVDVLNSFFGYTIQAQRGKPTNSEFVAMIADKIKLSKLA